MPNFGGLVKDDFDETTKISVDLPLKNPPFFLAKYPLVWWICYLSPDLGSMRPVEIASERTPGNVQDCQWGVSGGWGLLITPNHRSRISTFGEAL